MAGIEIVIKISEEVYKNIQSRSTEIQAEGYTVENAILNGVPLPKGHGRLIDEEIVSLSGIHFETERDHAMMIGRLNSAPTIIEADKE